MFRAIQKSPQKKNKKKMNKKKNKKPNKPEVCIMIKLVTVVFSIMMQKSVQNTKEVKTFCRGRYNLPDYYQIMKYKSNKLLILVDCCAGFRYDSQRNICIVKLKISK